VPSLGQAYGHGEGNGREDKRRSPHGGAVDATGDYQFVENKQEEQDADAGGRSGCRWETDPVPRKAAERCPREFYGRYQDEPLMRVWSASGTPRGVDDTSGTARDVKGSRGPI
jgi:hypothetical protein